MIVHQNIRLPGETKNTSQATDLLSPSWPVQGVGGQRIGGFSCPCVTACGFSVQAKPRISEVSIYDLHMMRMKNAQLQMLDIREVSTNIKWVQRQLGAISQP